MSNTPTNGTDSNVGLRPYRTHDVFPDTPSGSDQAITDCPFCEAEDKFYINKETGQFDCKVCGQRGNPISFVRDIYEHSKERTPDEAYKKLAKERGYLKGDTIKTWGLVQSSISGKWLYPGYYGNHHLDKIKNVYVWKMHKEKMRLFSTASLKQCLFNLQNFDSDKNTIYLTEGCWDGMALWEMLALSKWNDNGTLDYTGNIHNSLLSDACVLSIPSVNTFDESWAKFFSGKKVIIIPHNDHPKVNKLTRKKETPLGEQMIRRIVGMLMQLDKPPTEVNYLAWSDITDTYDESLKSGYDIRDMLREGKDHESRVPILLRIFGMIRPVHPRWIDESSDQFKAGKLTLDTLPCDNYKQLIDAWAKALVWHDGMEKTLAVMLSCVASTMMEEDQLWARIIAPPSSGKTVLCDALCVNRKYVSPQSHIRGFYSGMRPRDNDDGKPSKSDYGLIAEIMDKTFVTKDGDTLLRSVNHDQIMAEARDLYDGNTKTHFKNDMGREYKEIRTTWILCGTESLRYLDTSELGERFITVILINDVSSVLELSMARQSLRSLFKNIRFKNEKIGKSVEEQELDEARQTDKPTNEMQVAKRLTGGYITFLRSEQTQKRLKDIGLRMTEEQDEEIIKYAYFVSFMRARPSKKQEEKANKELCTRLSRQFGKLAICLAVVMNKKQVDDEVLSIVRSVALDTAAGTVFDIAKLIYDMKRLPEVKKRRDGLSFDYIKTRLKQKDDRMHELLRYMRRIKAAKIDYIDVQGRSIGKYKLTEDVENIMRYVYGKNKYSNK